MEGTELYSESSPSLSIEENLQQSLVFVGLLLRGKPHKTAMVLAISVE